MVEDRFYRRRQSQRAQATGGLHAPNGHPYTYPDAYGDNYADADEFSHAHDDADGNADCYAQRNDDRDGHDHSIARADGYGYTHGHTHCNAHGDPQRSAAAFPAIHLRAALLLVVEESA